MAIFPDDYVEKTTIAADDMVLFSDSEDGDKLKKAKYSNLKGEKGDPGTPGQDGTDGASIVSAAFSGDDIVFTKDNSQTVTLADAKTTLQGPQGEPGEEGEEGPAGNGIASITSSKSGKITTVTITETNGDVETFTVSDGADGQGVGDVVGPNSSTDGHLAVFDGATGKLIKDGGAIPTGVPAVGTNGQVLTVVSGAAAWANAPAETVVSGDSGQTYTIKVSASAPGSGTPNTTITFVTA